MIIDPLFLSGLGLILISIALLWRFVIDSTKRINNMEDDISWCIEKIVEIYREKE